MKLKFLPADAPGKHFEEELRDRKEGKNERDVFKSIVSILRQGWEGGGGGGRIETLNSEGFRRGVGRGRKKAKQG